jgi:hypothetical protein
MGEHSRSECSVYSEYSEYGEHSRSDPSRSLASFQSAARNRTLATSKAAREVWLCLQRIQKVQLVTRWEQWRNVVMLLQLLEREMERKQGGAHEVDALLASAMNTLVLCFRLGRRQALVCAVDHWISHTSIHSTRHFDLANIKRVPTAGRAEDQVPNGQLLQGDSYSGQLLPTPNGTPNSGNRSGSWGANGIAPNEKVQNGAARVSLYQVQPPGGLSGPGGPGGGPRVRTGQQGAQPSLAPDDLSHNRPNPQ